MSKQKKVDLIDLILIFSREKLTIIKIVGIITVLGIIVAFIIPKSYSTEMTFIVTDGNSINLPGSGLLGGLGSFSSNNSNISADQILVLLRSNNIQDKVISKFNLKELYNNNIQEYVRKKLDQRLGVEDIRPGGLGFNSIIAINLKFTEEDPKLSYDILQYYFQILEMEVQSLNRKNLEEAYSMLKSRLDENIIDLAQAEDSLVSFQEQYGVFEVQEQVKQQVQAVSDLQAEIVKIEVEIEYLTKIFGNENTNIMDLTLKKESLSKKVNELTSGEDLNSNSLFKPLINMPQLGVEYLRLYRNVVVQEQIYKVLLPQFEQQKLNFEETNSGLKIVDEATIPTYKSKPKRAYVILSFFVFSLFLTVVYILLKDWLKRVKLDDKETFEKLESIKSEFKFK